MGGEVDRGKGGCEATKARVPKPLSLESLTAGEGVFTGSTLPGDKERLSLKDKEKLLWVFKAKSQVARRARN